MRPPLCVLLLAMGSCVAATRRRAGMRLQYPLWEAGSGCASALSCVARLAVGEAEKTQLNRRFVPDGRPRRRQSAEIRTGPKIELLICSWPGHPEPERAAGRLLTPSGRPASGKARGTDFFASAINTLALQGWDALSRVSMLNQESPGPVRGV